MNVLVVLIPVSLSLGLLGLVAFLWTIRTRQYDDPVGEASRVLLNFDPQDGGGETADLACQRDAPLSERHVP